LLKGFAVFFCEVQESDVGCQVGSIAFLCEQPGGEADFLT
jgi:hypothetical protein